MLFLTLIVDNNMLRITAICLGHKENLTGNYQTIQELKDAVFEKYRKYLVKGDNGEQRVKFILTYTIKTETGMKQPDSDMEKPDHDMKRSDNEKLLEDINIIKTHAGQCFQLSVKRVRRIITIDIELSLQKTMEPLIYSDI
jgi:hypothetical protein